MWSEQPRISSSQACPLLSVADASVASMQRCDHACVERSRRSRSHRQACALLSVAGHTGWGPCVALRETDVYAEPVVA